MTPQQAASLGLGRIPDTNKVIKPYLHNRDLKSRPRGVMVIDLFGYSQNEVRQRFPAIYQWISERVKPVRDTNARESDEAVRDGISINGLPILALEPDLDRYYYDNVIGGPGAFMVPARNYETFADAILKKLITEIASRL